MTGVGVLLGWGRGEPDGDGDRDEVRGMPMEANGRQGRVGKRRKDGSRLLCSV